MATVKPFKAYRFAGKAGDISTLCCPPYDIIPQDKQRYYLNINRRNIIRLELPTCVPGLAAAEPYEEAARLLNEWIGNNYLKRDEKPSLYIYRLRFTFGGETKNLTGFIAGVGLVPFDKGEILPHEFTLSKAKEDRRKLMTATKASISPIYSLFSDTNGVVTKLLAEMSAGAPDMTFTDSESVTHSVWILNDEDMVTKICGSAGKSKLFIADGHHRYETSLELTPGGIVPMMLVPITDDGLVVLPTHRVVTNLTGFNSEDVLRKCAAHFDITPDLSREKAETALASAYRDGKTAFVLYTGGNYTLLTLKDADIMDELLPEAGAVSRSLDVNVLHTLILERIFGIDKENLANQKNLRYTRDIAEALSAVDNKQADCAFLLNPTRIEQIRDVAAAG